MGDLRDTVGETVGRRIDHVFARVMNDGRQQLYLHFDDGTYIELYGSFQCSSEIREQTIAGLLTIFESQRNYGTFVEYPVRKHL